MSFRTKLDFSDNRQVKQHIKTKTVLSGATSFGVPYVDLPSGPDFSTSSITQTITSITSTFSGNSTTTNYTWYDSRMSLANNVLSAITPTTSAYTQNTGQVYTGNSYTIIDDNTIYSTYSGVSFDISATTFISLGGGNYSGSVYTNTLRILSYNSLDFTGRTIWNDVSGITRTDRLIVSRGAQTGYILGATDSEGMVEWIPTSGFEFSGGSGNCITDLYVTNVFGCSPIRVHDDIILSGTTSKKLGINTTPSYTFDMLSQDGTSKLFYDDTTDSQSLILSGKTNGLYYVDVRATDVGILRLGVVGKSYSGNTTFGVTGDSYVYSSVLSNGLNIISSPGGLSSTTSDYIRFYAGNTATSQPDLHIQGSGATRGNIGIGTTDPKDTLHIKGSASVLNLEGSDHVYMNFYPDGYSAGRKAWFGFGNSTDDNISLTNQTVTGGTVFKTNDITRMFISASGNSGNVGIGTIVPTEKLDVNGRTKTTTIQVTSGATNGYVLISDSNGVGRWGKAASDIFTTGSTNNNAIYDIIGSHTLSGVSDYSIIAGGYGNTITGSTYSGIFAGSGNTISSTSKLSVIAGGNLNTISGHTNAFIGGGQNNFIDFCSSKGKGNTNESIIGGSFNEIDSAINSSIVGGGNNLLNNSSHGGQSSTILGGSGNTMTNGHISTMIGGSGNTLGDSACALSYSTIIGGYGNNISSVNTGGFNMIANSITSSIDGQYALILNSNISNIFGNSYNSSIIGGSGNTITSSDYVIIDGGKSNNIDSSDYSIIGGGSSNIIIDSTYSGLFAGSGNTITNTSFNSVIAGGSGNTVNGHNNAFIGGGSDNTIHEGCPSTELPINEAIIGGSNNIISAATSSVILGGSENSITKYTRSVTIGGYRNSFIDTTYDNLIYCDDNTEDNIITTDSVIVGGRNNTVSNKVSNSVILGGSGNTITGNVSSTASYGNAIIGGKANGVGSNIKHSIVLGGYNITATTSDMVYVPDLIIDGLISVTNLQTNASGQLIDGASDIRLKQNINQLQNSLSILKNLRGVSFEYTQESNMGGGLRYGFIAQEVQEFIPDIVRSRVKGDGMLSLSYTEIIPLLVEAVKELSSGQTTNNTYLETQSILAEDNNIDLNHNGSVESAVGGGIRVINAIGIDNHAELITDTDGNFVTNNDFKPNALTIPLYTPTSSNDINGNDGNITRDADYLYIKCNNIWKRTKLEEF